MKKILIPILIIVVIVLFVLVYAEDNQGDNNVAEVIDDVAQKNEQLEDMPSEVKNDGSQNDFKQVKRSLIFKDYDENEVSMASFLGTPLIINSWAVWCPFCKKELPDFAKAQKEFGDKIKIIAIDRVESRATSKKYSDELGVTDDLIFLLDASDSFYRSIGGFSMPETIFVDSLGNIIEHKRGPMEIEEIRKKINNLLLAIEVDNLKSQ